MRGSEPKRVLVVENDDEAIREVVRELLEDDGYHVATAGNSAEALDYLRRKSGPLGHDRRHDNAGHRRLAAHAADEGRREPGRKVPVIAMSAGGNRTLASAPVCKDYLAKPITVQRLLNAIEIAVDIRRRSPPDSSPAHPGLRERPARSARCARADPGGPSQQPPARLRHVVATRHRRPEGRSR